MKQPLATWPGAGSGPALDVRRLPREVDVSRLGGDELFAGVARHQGASASFRLVDPHRGSLLLAVRSTDDAHERTRRDFADDCQVARIESPAALWRERDLPRRLRKLLGQA